MNWLAQFIQADTVADVQSILDDMDKAGIAYSWRPVGDRDNNEGTIRMGADAGDSLIERVTNAIDAILERAYFEKGDIPGCSSPREATTVWFGIPDGRVSKLPLHRRQELAKLITVTFRDSGERRQPTVVITDEALGRRQTHFPIRSSV